MPDYGIKASANLNTDSLLLTKLTSQTAALKIFKRGNASITTDGSGNAIATIPHGLDYAPLFHVFRQTTAQDTFFDPTAYSDAFLPLGGANPWAPGSLHHAIHAYADEENLYIQADGADPSTTLSFRYFLLVERSEVFSGDDGIVHTEDFGWKASLDTVNVLEAKEYQLAHSSAYRALQYYDAYREKETLTLPVMFASEIDTFVQEGSYIDFEHDLGYPPFFFAYVEGASGTLFQIPYNSENSIDAFNYIVTGFCDAQRIRISCWRSSTYTTTLLDSWSEETFTIRIIAFTENLLSTDT